MELPRTLEEPFLQGGRPPAALSVVLYPVKGERVYLPVEVTDPLVEALRTAEEIGARTVFVEPDLGSEPSYRQAHPDPYAVTRLGIAAYVAACRERRRQPSSFEDRRRAAGDRAALRRAAGGGPAGEVMAVVGLPLLEGVLEALARPQGPQPLSVPAPRGRLGDAPAPREPGRGADGDAVPAGGLRAPPRGPAAGAGRRRRRGSRATTGRSAWWAARGPRRCAPSRPPWTAWRAGSDPPTASSTASVCCCACSPSPSAATARRRASGCRPGSAARSAATRATWPSSRGQLLADLYDLAVAARGVADDNLGYELWELGAAYPAQEEKAEIAAARISGESIWDGLRRIRLRRRLHRPKVRLRPRGLKGRKKETRPGPVAGGLRRPRPLLLPARGHRGRGLRAVPRRRGKSILSEERSRVEPFTTSLLDGVDVRETIRNWHLSPEGRASTCASWAASAGDVGSVVVVFDEDRDERYPYRMTWLGEHEQESDMAFYSTDPHQAVVGPGIMRAEYGGFLLSYPPRRMADVWSGPRLRPRADQGGDAAAGRRSTTRWRRWSSTWRRGRRARS